QGAVAVLDGGALLRIETHGVAQAAKAEDLTTKATKNTKEEALFFVLFVAFVLQAVALASPSQPSIIAAKAAPQSRSTFSASRSSARVRPRLIAATGLPSRTASRTKR